MYVSIAENSVDVIFHLFTCLSLLFIVVHYQESTELTNGITLTRAPTEGGIRPRRFFADIWEIAARSCAKFVTTIPSSLLHIMRKW